jgi:hypothetical protein
VVFLSPSATGIPQKLGLLPCYCVSRVTTRTARPADPNLWENGSGVSQPAALDSYASEVWAQNPSEPEGEGPRSTGSGAGSAGKAPANERRVSRTDPQAAIISDRKKGLFLAHKVHVAVDGGPARIITGLIATPGDRPEAHGGGKGRGNSQGVGYLTANPYTGGST